MLAIERRPTLDGNNQPCFAIYIDNAPAPFRFSAGANRSVLESRPVDLPAEEIVPDYARKLRETLIFANGVSLAAVHHLSLAQGYTTEEADSAIGMLIANGEAFLEGERLHGMLLDWPDSRIRS
jgi:hypothetical protein